MKSKFHFQLPSLWPIRATSEAVKLALSSRLRLGRMLSLSSSRYSLKCVNGGPTRCCWPLLL